MLTQEMEKLHNLFAEQCTLVEKMVDKAIIALLTKNEDIANEVITIDELQCNSLEMQIEKMATDIIALFAPKATEMRKLIAILKANRDLERIGDQTVNIAESVLFLIPRAEVKPLIDIPQMAEYVKKMISQSLKAFLQGDMELAQDAFVYEDKVDDLNVQIIRELITYMIGDPKTIERAMKLIFISRNLERIGDLSTNLAEEVIYYLTGKDIRHPGNTTETQGEK